jgi:hypothetical protein
MALATSDRTQKKIISRASGRDTGTSVEPLREEHEK